MLEKLFISKVRLKILTVFLGNSSAKPPVEMHVRGLVRLLDEEINAIRRELKNLVEAGILTHEDEANKVVYKLNEKNLFINELRQLILKNNEIVIELSTQLSKFELINMAILSHHFIDNLYSSDTDIDLLLIGEASIEKLNVAINSIERQFEKQIKVSLIGNTDFEFRKKKRDPFLLNILLNEKLVLFGDISELILN